MSRSRAVRPLKSPSAVSRVSHAFVITDLLPHLAADQMKKTMAEGIPGEGLNILIGSTPYADEGKDRVKLAVMSLLNDMYGSLRRIPLRRAGCCPRL